MRIKELLKHILFLPSGRLGGGCRLGGNLELLSQYEVELASPLCTC